MYKIIDIFYNKNKNRYLLKSINVLNVHSFALIFFHSQRKLFQVFLKTYRKYKNVRIHICINYNELY